MPRSLAAAGALAALLAATAVAQDPRLGRLDATARPLVAGVIDSARAAGLPTEPLVQRALEGATKGAPGTLIASAVQRLAADLGRARAVLGAGATPPELEAGGAGLRAGGGGPRLAPPRRAGPPTNTPPLARPPGPPVRAPAAQTTGTFDIGMSTVRYDGFLASGAASVTPGVRWERPNGTLTARGTYLRFESGHRSLQGSVAGSFFMPAAHRWRGEF